MANELSLNDRQWSAIRTTAATQSIGMSFRRNDEPRRLKPLIRCLKEQRTVAGVQKINHALPDEKR